MKFDSTSKFLAGLLIAFLICCMFGYPANAQADLRTIATQIVKDMTTDADVVSLKGEKLLVAEFDNINGKGDAVPRIFKRCSRQLSLSPSTSR